MFQVYRMSSVAAVAAENAIDHGADEGNAIAGASIVAIAGVIASAAVVDRAAAVVAAAAVIAAAVAARSDDTSATSVASRSATGGASHRASAAPTSGKGLSAAGTSGRGLSAATMTTILMAGSQRVRRHWHATQRDRRCESDESFFVKHVILLCSKQKAVCDCTDNVDRRQGLQGKGTHLRVRRAMRFALIVFPNDESSDSLKIVSRSAAVAERLADVQSERRGHHHYQFNDPFHFRLPARQESAPAAGGWGASRAAGAGLDFGVTPDQDAAILRIQVGWSLCNFAHPVAIGSGSAGRGRAQSIRRYGRRIRRFWGCSWPVAASFSRYPDRPAHRAARVFCGRSRPRLTGVRLRRIWRGIAWLHGALLNVLASFFICERNTLWQSTSEQNCSLSMPYPYYSVCHIHTTKCRKQRRFTVPGRFPQKVDPLYCSNQDTN